MCKDIGGGGGPKSTVIKDLSKEFYLVEVLTSAPLSSWGERWETYLIKLPFGGKIESHEKAMFLKNYLEAVKGYSARVVYIKREILK